MQNVYLVDGARTPQGRYGGALAQVRPDDLAATVVAESVRRAGMPADAVDEVILGAANQAGEDNRNVARMAVLLAGLPEGESPQVRKVTLSMGETAEEVAAAENITRAESDAFALRSQQRAAAAVVAGHFDREIVPVTVGDTEISADETPRPNTTPERLTRLRPVFRADGIVTAGSSSPLSDGAAALVVASEAAVREHDLTVRARIVASANAGIAPNVMGLGPVPSTRRALDRAGWAITDLDAVELNEAFAVQSLGVIRQLKLDEEIVNADGGAIALGHPLGCSGARILLTLLGRMERGNHRRGLATLCVGVGQGVSMLVEAS